MANKRTKRLRPAILQEDLDAFAALQAIEGYNPSNPAYTVEKGRAIFERIREDQTSEVQKDAAAEAQRDKAVNSEHDGHDFIQGMKNQVKAQYGEDSDEYASLGMKKKSEYRTGRRTPSTPPTTT
ncbi:MAG: hypothetical protein LUM44_03820 [Pyrinomonadaceae bacterium]|nr:hypothetical protein [Pyrinomonadaceae bacterium]